MYFTMQAAPLVLSNGALETGEALRSNISISRLTDSVLGSVRSNGRDESSGSGSMLTGLLGSTAISPRENTSLVLGFGPRVSSTSAGRNAQDGCKLTSLPFIVRLTLPTAGCSCEKSVIRTPTFFSVVSRLRNRKSSFLRVIGIIGSKRSSMLNLTFFLILDIKGPFSWLGAVTSINSIKPSGEYVTPNVL